MEKVSLRVENCNNWKKECCEFVPACPQTIAPVFSYNRSQRNAAKSSRSSSWVARRPESERFRRLSSLRRSRCRSCHRALSSFSNLSASARIDKLCSFSSSCAYEYEYEYEYEYAPKQTGGRGGICLQKR